MPFSNMLPTRLATFDVTLLMLMPSSPVSTMVTFVLGLSTSSSLPFSDSPLEKYYPYLTVDQSRSTNITTCDENMNNDDDGNIS